MDYGYTIMVYIKECFSRQRCDQTVYKSFHKFSRKQASVLMGDMKYLDFSWKINSPQWSLSGPTDVSLADNSVFQKGKGTLESATLDLIWTEERSWSVAWWYQVPWEKWASRVDIQTQEGEKLSGISHRLQRGELQSAWAKSIQQPIETWNPKWEVKEGWENVGK